MNTRLTNKLWALLKRQNTEELGEMIAGGGYLKTWRWIEEKLLSLRRKPNPALSPALRRGRSSPDAAAKRSDIYPALLRWVEPHTLDV